MVASEAGTETVYQVSVSVLMPLGSLSPSVSLTDLSELKTVMVGLGGAGTE